MRPRGENIQYDELRDRYEAQATKLNDIRDLLEQLPITTEELVRLRNANKITFDKQVNSITTCLIQLRGCFTQQRDSK